MAVPVKEEKKEDRLCGIGQCHPGFLQRFANIYCFSVFYVLNLLFRGMFGGTMMGVVTTIEKRFNLKTREMGVLFAINDIGHVLCVVLLSYYGGKKRKPLIMGTCQIFLAFSLFLFATPHFIFGPGTVASAASSASNSNETGDGGVCHAVRPDDNGTSCDNAEMDSAGNRTAYTIFALAQLLLGAFASAYHVLGLAYLDDNVRKDVAPILIGVTNSLPMMGPMLGYFLSAVCVSIYVDLSATNLKPSDPGWIGAWWFGFVLTSIFLFICAVPLTLFPKYMPKMLNTDKEMPEKEHLNKKHDPTQENIAAKMFEKPAELLKDIWRLAKNKVFVFLTLGSCLEFWQFALYYMFMPKYGEAQFGLSPTKANILNGVLLAFVTCGLLVGGVIMKRFKVQLKGYLLLIVIGGSVGVTGTFINMFTACPTPALAGNASLSTGWMYPTACDNCHCDSEQYAPVCASDNLTYYSPCHAGCATMNDTVQPKMYKECFCETDGSDWATSGKCLEDCSGQFYRFLGVMMGTLLITAPLGIAGMMARLRCITKEQKPLALSLQSFFWSLFAFMPGPVVSGALVDTTCLLWNKDKCDPDGSTGNCLLYDNDRLRYIVHGTTISFLLPAILFYLLALLSAKGKYFGDDDEEDKDSEHLKIDHYNDTAENNDSSKTVLLQMVTST